MRGLHNAQHVSSGRIVAACDCRAAGMQVVRELRRDLEAPSGRGGAGSNGSRGIYTLFADTNRSERLYDCWQQTMALNFKLN